MFPPRRISAAAPRSPSTSATARAATSTSSSTNPRSTSTRSPNACANRGPFAISERAAGTLNGLYRETRLQFLQAGLERPERRLEPTIRFGGLAVAGLGDLLAMKLNAIAGRGQLRDYFDLMTIEQHGGRTIEEGLGLFLARYQPAHQDSALTPILLALGHLDDVADDPFLPVERTVIVDYWERRQPEIVAALDRHGITRPEPPAIDL